jgi:hypothetical protein
MSTEMFRELVKNNEYTSPQLLPDTSSYDITNIPPVPSLNPTRHLHLLLNSQT